MNRITRSLFGLLLAISTTFAQSNKTPDFEKPPTVAWRFKTTQPVFSSPVISEGSVYFGGLDSTLYALNVSTGAVQWKIKTNGEIRSTPVIKEGLLYLLGGNGVLSCIDRLSGKPLWRSVFDPTALFMGERRYDFADYYHSSPVVDEQFIYFASGNGRVQCVSANGGKLVWSFQTGDIVHNSPVIQEHLLIVGCFDGYVYALDKRTGSLVWKFKSIGHQYFPVGEMQGSPALAGGSVFIGSRDYNFYALNGNTGHANWNRKFQNGWALAATTRDTIVYVGTSDDRILLALDVRDGREWWRASLKMNVFGGCAFSSGMVYVGTIWGKVFGIDARTGAIRWAFGTDGYHANRSHYLKEDDTFRDDIGSILKAPPHWIQAEYRMGGIFSTPAVAGDWLVITTTEGTVYGLKRTP